MPYCQEIPSKAIESLSNNRLSPKQGLGDAKQGLDDAKQGFDDSKEGL